MAHVFLKELHFSYKDEKGHHVTEYFTLDEIDEIRKKLPEEKGFDGVVFLSIKDPPGINFAIFGHSINKLEPRVVHLVRITDIDDYRFVAFKLLKSAKTKNGSLEWPESELNLE